MSLTAATDAARRALTRRPLRSSVLTAALALALALAGALAWAALSPVRSVSREQPFEIPRGTWARRMAGNRVEILPAEIHLTLGHRDILLLRNLDDVPKQRSQRGGRRPGSSSDRC